MYRIAYIFIIYFILFGQSLFSQPAGQHRLSGGALTGFVKDAVSGLPLEGATLYFPDLRLGAVTNEKGAFSIPFIINGRHVVDISYQGYAALALTLFISGDTAVQLFMYPTAAESEHVVVTGVSKATELRRTTIPISIVKKQDLYRSAAANIIDALAREAGVSVLNTGPAIAKPVIRGMGYNRVVTLHDGVRQEGQQWGDEHGIEIDEYSIQKVEILRGPASLMYGSDALGGVLNLMSRMVLPPRRIQANAVLTHQSNNNLRGWHINTSANTGGWQLGGYLSGKAAGDYRNREDGRVFNSRFTEMNAGWSAGIQKAWGYSHFSFSHFNQRLGIVEGERAGTGQFLIYPGSALERPVTDADLNGSLPVVPWQHIRHMKIGADHSMKLGSGRLTVQTAWQQNQRREFGDAIVPADPSVYFLLRTFSYGMAYHLQEKGGWKHSLGVNGMIHQNRNRGLEAVIPDYLLADAGLYLITQKSSGERLAWSGGVRADTRSLNMKPMLDATGAVKFFPIQRQFFNVAGSAGLSYVSGRRTIIKANISRGLRAPNAAELGSNGAHEGTNRYEKGRADLKSETSLQADLGLEYRTSHLQLVLTPFINRVNHFIYFEKLLSVNGGDSLTPTGGDFSITYRYNQQHATLAGFECAVDIHPHPVDWLHLEQSFSYVRGWFSREVDGTRHLPMMAPFRWLSEIRAELSPAKAKGRWSNVYVKMELDVYAAQRRAFTAYNTETATPGYVLLNAGVGADLKNRSGKVVAALHLAAVNLTDVAFQQHMSRLKYTPVNAATGKTGVFNMGRNISLRLVVPMQWSLK